MGNPETLKGKPKGVGNPESKGSGWVNPEKLKGVGGSETLKFSKEWAGGKF